MWQLKHLQPFKYSLGFLFVCLETGSHSIAKAGLELLYIAQASQKTHSNPPASAFQVLELQVCAITPCLDILPMTAANILATSD